MLTYICNCSQFYSSHNTDYTIKEEHINRELFFTFTDSFSENYKMTSLPGAVETFL